MPTLVILCGIQGSGKSTFAKWVATEMATVVVSTDAIRGELTGEYGRFEPTQSRRVFQIARERLLAALALDVRCVLFDATNATVKSRRPYIVMAKERSLPVGAVAFSIPLEDAVRRVLARHEQAPVPLHAVHELHAQWAPPTPAEGFDWVEEANGLDRRRLRNLL